MVHFQTTVIANFQQLIFDKRNVFWFAVRREAHHFVFAAVNSESGVVSERAIEQSQTIGTAQLLHPERHRFEKRTESGGRIIEIGFEQTVEFQQGLVIEAYVAQVFGVEFGFAETVVRGVEWKIMIMLYARESFFLRRSHDVAVNEQTGGGVVIES